MISRNKIISTLIWGTSLLLVLSGAVHSGLMINTTHSIPAGVYQRLAQKKPERGDYVAYCPMKNDITKMALERNYFSPGLCPGGTSKVYKKLIATAGDHVAITPDGVMINGIALPYSAQYLTDNLNRPMPRFGFNRALVDDEVLLMTDASPASFDARYFGPVNADQIVAVIRPLKTWSR